MTTPTTNERMASLDAEKVEELIEAYRIERPEPYNTLFRDITSAVTLGEVEVLIQHDEDLPVEAKAALGILAIERHKEHLIWETSQGVGS